MNLLLVLALFGSVLSFTASLSHDAVNIDLEKVNRQYDSALTNINQYGDVHIRQKRWIGFLVTAILKGAKVLSHVQKVNSRGFRQTDGSTGHDEGRGDIM